MGYKMRLMEADFRILKKDQQDALDAIKALAGQETIRGYDAPHFSWVDTQDFLSARHIEDALEAWRWKVTFYEETDDIVDINFYGGKFGDEDILFKAIAPFVVNNSYIQMLGEDGSTWRWIFKDGEVKEVSGKLSFIEDA